MPAAKHDLYIEQGATYRRRLVFREADELDENGEVVPGQPIDLSGYSARMQVRRTQQGAVAIALNSTLDGGLHIDGPLGQIDIHMTDEQTDVLTPKTALYDIEIESPTGDVTRLMQGKITVDPNITQESDDPVLEA